MHAYRAFLTYHGFIAYWSRHNVLTDAEVVCLIGPKGSIDLQNTMVDMLGWQGGTSKLLVAGYLRKGSVTDESSC